MTGRGRPPTGQRVDVRIPNELIEQIDSDATANQITRAAQIRIIITNHYQPKEQP